MPPCKKWLIAAVVFVVLEILPPPTHFYLTCAAFGALGASIAAFYSSLAWVPWAVFVITTLVLMPLLVPLSRLLFPPRP